jgi:hypothetical protein
MALQTQALENALKAAFDHGGSKEFETPAEERAYQAKKIAAAIETFIKSGTVNVTSLTATAGNILVTGTGTGNIS